MPKSCVLVVDLMGLICVKAGVFYTALKITIPVVDKSSGFTPLFTNVFLVVFHAIQEVFKSVNHYLLPIINMAYKDNDNVYINNY